MSINEKKFKMWREQVDRRLARLEEKNHKPKEPLLDGFQNEMDAIRAYGRSPLIFHRDNLRGCSTFNFFSNYIGFDRLFLKLEDGKTYTIDELCGEEEE